MTYLLALLFSLVQFSKARLGPAIRGVQWTAAFTDRNSDFRAFSWSKSKDVDFHLGRINWIMQEMPSHWLLELFVYHPQLSLATKIADRFPERTIIVTNSGGPLRCGRPLIKCEDYIDGLKRLARRPNIMLKLSGFGSPSNGLGYSRINHTASADVIAQDWGDIIRLAISIFTDRRVIFGSGFPLESSAVPLPNYWLGVKQVLKEQFLSQQQQERLLRDNAKELYSFT